MTATSTMPLPSHRQNNLSRRLNSSVESACVDIDDVVRSANVKVY
jgi:hypothetical protein